MPCQEMLPGGRTCGAESTGRFCDDHQSDRGLFDFCHSAEHRSDAAYAKVSPFNAYRFRTKSTEGA